MMKKLLGKVLGIALLAALTAGVVTACTPTPEGGGDDTDNIVGVWTASVGEGYDAMSVTYAVAPAKDEEFAYYGVLYASGNNGSAYYLTMLSETATEDEYTASVYGDEEASSPVSKYADGKFTLDLSATMEGFQLTFETHAALPETQFGEHYYMVDESNYCDPVVISTEIGATTLKLTRGTDVQEKPYTQVGNFLFFLYSDGDEEDYVFYRMSGDTLYTNFENGDGEYILADGEKTPTYRVTYVVEYVEGEGTVSAMPVPRLTADVEVGESTVLPSVSAEDSGGLSVLAEVVYSYNKDNPDGYEYEFTGWKLRGDDGHLTGDLLNGGEDYTPAKNVTLVTVLTRSQVSNSVEKVVLKASAEASADGETYDVTDFYYNHDEGWWVKLPYNDIDGTHGDTPIFTGEYETKKFDHWELLKRDGTTVSVKDLIESIYDDTSGSDSVWTYKLLLSDLLETLGASASEITLVAVWKSAE